MGVIFGYISLTDKPVDPAAARAMQKANSFWEPDGEGMFLDEHAAIGSLIMFNTPEAIFEKQPVYFAGNQKVLVATARIDNRDDLCRIFDIPLSARDIYPDSYYIRLAYEKWGESCPDYLIGDWSFAIYDKVTRKLFIARDHHGIMACYYYKGSDFFVFSSSLKGILCLPQVEKKVNEYKIAQMLVNWNEGGPQTCYLDIFRLPPAHTLLVNNKTVITSRYWYLEHTPEIRLKNDQEYVDMFRDLYTEAVRCRLRSYRPVGATLSGGLDSGSVCILASQELAKYGKRLPAYTAVPMYDVPWPKNRIGDEGPLAQKLANSLGNIDLTLSKSENINPIKAIETMLDIHDQPGYAAGNAFWITDMMQIFKCKNFGTLLIGQNGNGTVSWPSYNLISNNKNKIKNYIKKIINIKIKLNDNIKIDTPIDENIIKKYYLKNKIKKNFVRKYYYKDYSQLQHQIDILKPGISQIGNLWYETGLYFKIETRDPTADYYLIKYLFSIPIKNKIRNNKDLFSNTFGKYFNKEVIMGKIKGIQSSDLILRLENNDIKMKEEIENILLYKNLFSYEKLLNLINNWKENENINYFLKIITITKFLSVMKPHHKYPHLNH